MKCPRCQTKLQKNRYCGLCGFDSIQPTPSVNKIFGSIIPVIFWMAFLSGYLCLIKSFPTALTPKSLITIFCLICFLILSLRAMFFPIWIYDEHGIVRQDLIRLSNLCVSWKEIEKISYWNMSLNPRFFIRTVNRRFEIPVLQTRNYSKVMSDIVSYAIKNNPKVVIDDDTLKKIGRSS